MRRATVFALSSNYEGFPNVLLEAMACGTPVVAADCPHGPAEILMGGHYGILIPVGDEAAMVKALMLVLDDADLRQRFIIQGRLRTEEYSVPRIAIRYLDLFRGLTGSQARPKNMTVN
jgi:glycosyltransferase involved in cell wall biosynthesis